MSEETIIGYSELEVKHVFPGQAAGNPPSVVAAIRLDSSEVQAMVNNEPLPKATVPHHHP